MKRQSLLLIVFLLFIITGRSQTYGFDVELKNFEQVDETTIEWDIYLKKADGTSDFAMWQMQTRIEFNNDILNSGNFANGTFTIMDVGSSMNQETDFFDDDDCTVVGSSPNIQLNWAVSSPPATGQSMTVVSDAWLKVARFKAQLLKSGNPHNFTDADPEFAFETIGANILVTRANTTSTTYDGSGSTPVPRNSTIPSLGVKINDRQLAGYWFSGEGNWATTGNWNNVTSENTNQLPGANSNAIINGNCTILTGKSYSLQPSSGNGGELTVLTGEEPLYTLAVQGSEADIDVRVYDVANAAFLFDWTNSGSVDLPAGTVVHLQTRYTGFGFATFDSWTDQSSNVLGSSTNLLNYAMPAGNMTITANWTITSPDGSNLKTYNQTNFERGQNHKVDFDKVNADYKNGTRDELNASLTIAPGGALTVDKLFNDNVNEAPAVLVQSTADGTGSLIHSNTGVAATAQQYINRWSAKEKGIEQGWHFLSSPVSTQAIRTEFVPENPIPDYIDFYKWDESWVEGEDIGWWINTKDASGNWNNNFEDYFVVGRGYLLSYGTPPAKEYGDKAHIFAGVLNVEDVTKTGLTRTSGSTYPGWHLVGNPFSSAIDLDEGSWTKTNIAAVPQIWNESSASYKVISGEGIIPAHNGFMIYTSGDGSLKIPADARVHSNSSWYKSKNSDQIMLVANDLDRNTKQETVIRFNAEATDEFDMEYDAFYIPGFAPMLYSVSNSKLFALNTLPELSSELTVPLGFVKNESSNFNISLEHSIDGETIYLNDLKLNKSQNMSLDPVYSFESATGDNPNRFLLSFDVVGVIESPESGLSAWCYDNSLFIRSQYDKTYVDVYDVMGIKRFSKILYDSDLQILQINQTPGFYILHITGGSEQAALKIYIN